ncbi:hypothetical protein FOL47_008211 [Perkinsus chesapeaki]|uniref:Lipase maturation factor 1/2 N-terminal domain-containing protein n=1 Tax=Perkinsus chesapeaki TaxID=330153 RepID=A0A7J6LFP6_PERCH|nr:hypothetical protein FOL47_008211 [Perkinsus chesapeaki]
MVDQKESDMPLQRFLATKIIFLAQAFAFSSFIENSEVIYGPCGIITVNSVLAMVILTILLGEVGRELLWSGCDRLLVEASLMLFISDLTNSSIILKFLSARIFLASGINTFMKNDLVWTSFADMSWSSILDAPFPLPLVWHANKFPPILHSFIGCGTLSLEILGSILFLLAPSGGPLEFLCTAGLTKLTIWFALVDNLNWSVLTILALLVGMLNEKIIAAVVGTDIFGRLGCKRVIPPLTEEVLEKTILKSIPSFILYCIIIGGPVVLLICKNGSLNGLMLSKEIIYPTLLTAVSSLPLLTLSLYSVIGGWNQKNTMKTSLANRIFAFSAAVMIAWAIGTTGVLGNLEGPVFDGSVFPSPTARQPSSVRSGGEPGPPLPHTLETRSALTFQIHDESKLNPDQNSQGVWEFNMPFSVNSDQRPKFLSFHHPRVDFLVWKLQTEAAVEAMGASSPFFVRLITTCLAVPERCGQLPERIFMPKGDLERKILIDNKGDGRRAVAAFSRLWRLTEDKFSIYWWSTEGSGLVTGAPLEPLIALKGDWCPEGKYRNPGFQTVAKMPVTMNEISIMALVAGFIARLIFSS